MTDEPKTEAPQRSEAEVNDEYNRCCTLLGDKQYKIKFFSAEVELLLEKMRQLNLEMVQILRASVKAT